MKKTRGHILLTPATCRHRHRQSGGDCLVCVGGLSICANCGRAEAELDEPCPGMKFAHAVNPAEHVDEDGPIGCDAPGCDEPVIAEIGVMGVSFCLCGGCCAKLVKDVAMVLGDRAARGTRREVDSRSRGGRK